MAEDLKERASTNRSPLAPPIFLLPGVAGEEKLWKAMAEIPGLVPVAYPTSAQLIRNNLDMGYLFAEVRRQIEERAPTGPISMIGYSIGGSLAFASASNFRAAGRIVDCIVIMDAAAIELPPGKSAKKRLGERVKNLFTFQLRSGLASVLGKGLATRPFLPLLPLYAAMRPRWIPFGFAPFLEEKLRVQLLLRLYWPWWRGITARGVLPGVPTFVLRSEEFDPSWPGDLGWSNYCADLEVVQVAGSHLSMVTEPNIGPLRATVMSLIGAARQARGNRAISPGEAMPQTPFRQA